MHSVAVHVAVVTSLCPNWQTQSQGNEKRGDLSHGGPLLRDLIVGAEGGIGPKNTPLLS